jgi:hypothetical protein
MATIDVVLCMNFRGYGRHGWLSCSWTALIVSVGQGAHEKKSGNQQFFHKSGVPEWEQAGVEGKTPEREELGY